MSVFSVRMRLIVESILASDAEMGMTAIHLAVSDYTNGAVLIVDGGFALVNP